MDTISNCMVSFFLTYSILDLFVQLLQSWPKKKEISFVQFMNEAGIYEEIEILEKQDLKP